MVSDQCTCFILPCDLLLITVNIHRKSWLVKQMFNKCTSLSYKPRPFSCTNFASVDMDLLIASAILQSSLLSALHVWKRPQKRVLCHGKVPKQFEVAFSSVCARHKTSQEFTSRYRTEHVHSQNVEWNPPASKRTQRKFRTVKGDSERKKR